MARIIAIDFGEKRTGIAVTDTLQIIANSLTTIDTQIIHEFLDDYCAKEQVEKVVIGYPKTLRNEPAVVTTKIDKFLDIFTNKHPEIEIIKFDERFTSKMAFQTMIDSGIGRKARRNKALIDQISATIILQSYLESTKYNSITSQNIL
ncbi:MAG: Holliday junction resolvase RuvX [bacterium]|nr:Holliday junction resolvase RuvX [Candidatus Minthenecus merdequi]